MVYRLLLIIAGAIFLATPASAQLISPQDEWFGMLDEATIERGITVSTAQGAVTMGIRPGVLTSPTRAVVRHTARRATAPSQLTPRDGMRYASDLYYYQFFDALSFHGDIVVALESEPLTRRGGVYLFDMRQDRWFPLRTIQVEPHYFRAFTDSLSGYVAVLEYENADAELLSLVGAARAVVAANSDDHFYVAHHSRDVYPVASLTKLMTALVFLDHNPGWQRRVAITAQDDAPPAKLALVPNDVVAVRDLFESMLMGSKNNAAQAVARATGLSRDEFIKKMNEKTHALGMEDTRFVDVTGLSPENKGTARDLARLAREAFSNADIRRATGKTVMSVRLYNRNQTLGVRTTNDLVEDGIKTLGKTGYLPSVGYNLALIKQQNGKPIVFVILGAQTSDERFELGKKLLERPW